jgi:hypothetical protein
LCEPSLKICCVECGAIAARWSGVEDIGWRAVIDGAPFVVERGVAGDHRFVHGAHPDECGVPVAATRAIHHLSADANVLRCAPSDRADPSWWRVVLDSVLLTVARLRGHEALHAGALATSAGVIAITAASGGGKSTLLAELLGRGLTLMADDVLVLESQETGSPLAYPAPPLMTVPAASVPMLCEGDPTEAISSIGDERWIGFPTHSQPMTLRALVVLDRIPIAQSVGRLASLTKIENPLSPLLTSLMDFPRAPERQRARFELASALARDAGVWRLTASVDTAPDALADALLGAEL